MGDYLTMEGDVLFKSPLTFEEVERRFKSSEDLAGEYEICNADSGKHLILIKPYGEEYYAKFYHDKELAYFISTVVDSEDQAVLEFAGGDGYRGGYLIFYTNPFDAANKNWQIFVIYYEAMVENMSLGEFIEHYKKGGVR